MDFSVRPALQADVERMAAIWYEAAEALAKADPCVRLAPNAIAVWRAATEQCLSLPNMAHFVAVNEQQTVIAYIIGECVANAPAFLPERYGLVRDLAIDHHAKSGRMSSALLTALRAWFAEQGITELQVRVPYHHPVAQAFWRALGARKIADQFWLKL
ncbi:MAG: hypothetical protein CUN49_05720 [Candidatus Thermofonsia Clade 1 bacterium]|uniref:N-acetyltransferase domain-containing protein n=1 Tax=Candidatus Thermofonsia Clade 1 bacterium TaxID=2364210 RepID=A0A2M8PZW8_9CHLR|nr:MAG: hypothetical protein CUN49_05720 [Candidatus Thermofonsia Clade 1 bacterium]PJF43091.1 MAG: hypothetical protein CUN50_01510 [Candidatus Thermofonsia Clade 1 bacterium]RMF51750.1 MAG: GNAT family N-acetyltransferase [Chloroflexota bacterium]